jgi:hypothetical protein
MIPGKRSQGGTQGVNGSKSYPCVPNIFQHYKRNLPRLIPLPLRERGVQQPFLLVRIAHCSGAFHRVCARHGQVKPLVVWGEDFGDGDDLQPIILSVEQGMLIFASGGNFIAHRLGRHVHAEQYAKIGLFADAVRIELGEITAPGFARFYLKDRLAIFGAVFEEIGNAINAAIGTLFLVNPRLITRVGEDEPFLKFLACPIILAVGERDGQGKIARHRVEQDIRLNGGPVGGIFILKALYNERD